MQTNIYFFCLDGGLIVPTKSKAHFSKAATAAREEGQVDSGRKIHRRSPVYKAFDCGFPIFGFMDQDIIVVLCIVAFSSETD